jgi:hypothetical protein
MNRKYASRLAKRYTQVAPGTVYESSIQNLVNQNITALFPDYVGALVEPYFSTPAGDVQPDIVIIKRDASGWGLVEVEVEGHSWTSHILPQMNKLKLSNVGNLKANKIHKFFTDHFSEIEIEKAMSSDPAVFLAIHGSALGGKDRLQQLGVEAVELDVFSSPPNDYILVLKELIEVGVDIETIARKATNPLFPRFWKITNAELLGKLSNAKSVLVNFDGKVGYWDCMTDGQAVTISQPSQMELNPQTQEAKVKFDTGTGELVLTSVD